MEEYIYLSPVSLLQEKKGVLKIEPLITHTFGLEEAPTVFRDLAGGKYIYNKVMFIIN